MAEKKPSPKSKVEAVLFSVGRRIRLDEIAKLCRILKEDALVALKELQKEYDEKQSSLMLVEDGDHWKFTVRDHLIPVVRKIVTETELTKSVLETLAVIAFKYPILQADLIKIRTNKAYDHLVELENAGYISRQKHSRTNLIKLTEKFFRYFDLTEEKLKDQFRDFSSIAAAIAQKETEVDALKADQKKRAEELKAQDEKIKQEIENLDQAGEEYEVPLETYEEKKETVSEIVTSENRDSLDESEAKEILNEVEVVSVDPAKEKDERKIISENDLSNQDPSASKSAHNRPKRSKGIHLTPEQEKIAEQKAEDIIHGTNNSSKQAQEQK